MIYTIKVFGCLDESWSDWLGKMQIHVEEANGGWVTTIHGQVTDQPALFGILDRIQNLNLPLLFVEQMDEEH